MSKFRTLFVGGILALSLLAMGCGNNPSDVELQTLRETRQAAEQAEQRVEDLEQQKRDLEAELESKQEELARAKAEQSRVEEAINEKQQMESE